MLSPAIMASMMRASSSGLDHAACRTRVGAAGGFVTTCPATRVGGEGRRVRRVQVVFDVEIARGYHVRPRVAPCENAEGVRYDVSFTFRRDGRGRRPREVEVCARDRVRLRSWPAGKPVPSASVTP
jgi:hypothetical protein